jgi:6-phospho-beta-glucosidase
VNLLFFVSLAEEKESSATNGTRAEVVQQLEKDLFELYRDPELNVKPTQLEKRDGAYYSEAACSLINWIYNDKRDIQPVNIRNYGAIAVFQMNQPMNVVTKEGSRPISIGDLPVAVRDWSSKLILLKGSLLKLSQEIIIKL